MVWEKCYCILPYVWVGSLQFYQYKNRQHLNTPLKCYRIVQFFFRHFCPHIVLGAAPVSSAVRIPCGISWRLIRFVKQFWCFYPLQGQSKIFSFEMNKRICNTAKYENGKIEGCVYMYLFHVFWLIPLKENLVTSVG
jgi:hypothetical protein